ncbi:hypothetical protein EC973_008491 [Apophysomyces ossiformis]|uniref:Uncharacterized protein n=1 Tax=Apophysomyces ossiformis TaxID=679940 RepID=A0A8H7BWV7_9FUNG|nr:hypothetical protein EC973_008491 [Apophysomyces ossiformis]
MSTEQGTKPNFSLNDCTAEYPSLLQDETQSEEQEYLLHFYWMTKVVHVHASVLDFMRRKYIQNQNESTDDEQRTFQELQSRLDELRTQLTSTIPLPRNFANSKKRYMTSFVHMALHFVTILLHRPYAFQNSTRGNHLALHQERCSLAALTITQITEVLVKDDGVECLCYFMRGIQQVMHYLSAAVTVYSSRNGSNASVGGNNLSERSLALIQQLIEKSPATELDSKFDENLLPCPQTKNNSKASENLPARFDSHNTPPVKAASPKTAKPRRMSAKLGSTRPNTPQRKASTTRPLSWDVNSNVSLSFLMQSSAAITDPAGRHHLGFPAPPAAITQSPYPYYPLQTHALGPGIDQQTSIHFPITNYTQPLSSSAEYYPSFDPAEIMNPYPVFVPSSMYCSPVSSSDMYAHPLPSGHPPSGTPIQHNPYVTSIPPFSSPSTSSSQRRHTFSGTCQQPNPALLAEMNALTAANGIPPSLPPNMNLSSSHIDSAMQGHTSQMMIDESYLTEPPPTGMQPQSMMSLLTGHDSSWDYSNRVQNA